MAGLCRIAAAAARSLSRYRQSLQLRHFSAAAALQLDYESDFDCDHYDREGKGRPWELADAFGDYEWRGVQWVFMGNPSAQKHVYAARISSLLGVPYISMGSLVRQEINPGSSLYKQIAKAISEGKLVPEDVIFSLLAKRLEEGHNRGENGFILDGIPRTRIQAEILDQIAEIDLVVNFKCMGDCLVKNNLGAHACSYCRKSFKSSCSESTAINPLATTTCHAQPELAELQSARNEEKFRVYKEQNLLLEEYYRMQKKLLNFQVAGAPAETWKGLMAALHLQQIDAVSSSQKLTAR